VHYSAVFEDGKTQEKLSTQSRTFGSRDAEKRFEEAEENPRAYLKLSPPKPTLR
jgi:hypothetical protein